MFAWVEWVEWVVNWSNRVVFRECKTNLFYFLGVGSQIMNLLVFYLRLCYLFAR